MSTDIAKSIESALRKAAVPAEVESPQMSLAFNAAESLVGLLVRSMLLWEAPTSRAAAATTRIEQSVVDYNELRVSLSSEIVSFIGERYPNAEDRCGRLKGALQEIYLREHSVTLKRLPTMEAAKAKEYLHSLPGLPRFVASRVLLLGLEHHAAPVDGRIAQRLAAAGVVSEGSSADSIADLLQAAIEPARLKNVYLRLHAWSDLKPPETDEGHARTATRNRKKTRA